MTRFEVQCRVDAPRGELYAWHARPSAFERLAPADGSVRLIEDSGGIGDGARKVLALGPIGLRWVAVHDRHEFGRGFRDVQERGPFRRWEHTHRFEDDGPRASILRDTVEYELPFGRLGDLVAGRAIASQLRAMFARRHEVTQHDVSLFAHEPPREFPLAVHGTGRAADQLRAFLATGGWRLVDDAPAAVVLQHGEAHTASGELLAPFSDASDAALARIHRAARRFGRDTALRSDSGATDRYRDRR